MRLKEIGDILQAFCRLSATPFLIVFFLSNSITLMV